MEESWESLRDRCHYRLLQQACQLLHAFPLSLFSRQNSFHLSPVLSTEPQSCSTCPPFFFPLPLLLFLQSPLQSLISFNPAITSSDFLLTPYISFIFSEQETNLVGCWVNTDTVRPQSRFLVKKNLVILFNCSLMPLRCQ